jgi:hypothetical protein
LDCGVDSEALRRGRKKENPIADQSSKTKAYSGISTEER